MQYTLPGKGDRPGRGCGWKAAHGAETDGNLADAAARAAVQTSQRLASGEETGYGLGWDLETVALSGRRTAVVGHDGDSLGGMVASFMTFRDRGIVVSVVSNISYADTFGLATRIAEPFAQHGTIGAGGRGR